MKCHTAEKKAHSVARKPLVLEFVYADRNLDLYCDAFIALGDKGENFITSDGKMGPKKLRVEFSNAGARQQFMKHINCPHRYEIGPVYFADDTLAERYKKTVLALIRESGNNRNNAYVLGDHHGAYKISVGFQTREALRKFKDEGCLTRCIEEYERQILENPVVKPPAIMIPAEA